MVEHNDYASCPNCWMSYSAEASWSHQTPKCHWCSEKQLVRGVKPLRAPHFHPFSFVTAPFEAGSTALVYHGINLNTLQPVIGKRFTANTVAAVGHDKLVEHAEAMANLTVPGVVSTYDIRRSGEEVVLVLPEIHGQTLRRHHFSPGRRCEEALKLIIRTLEILEEMHQRGWEHNDVKPTNIMVSRQHVTLLDLCSAGKRGKIPTVPSFTPAFASPQLALEHWDEHDDSGDVYSVGKTFVALVLGSDAIKTVLPPRFSGESVTEYWGKLEAGRAAELRALECVGIDESVRSMIEEWTELEPSRRPRTAAEARAHAAAVAARLVCLRSAGYAKRVGWP